MRRGLRTLIITSTVATVAAGALVTPSAGAEPAESPTAARIGVSVATLWTSPDAPRMIDAAALGTAANPATWLRSLSTGERRGLNGRVESQALYGQPVEVLEQRDGWARVVLPTQPSPKDDRGYPGWIPVEQLVTADALSAETSPPTGLEAVGDNLFLETPASGGATTGVPGSAGFGSLLQGFVETSNVNAVAEITNLIQAQRAYEMNSKVITTSDEMLRSVNTLR